MDGILSLIEKLLEAKNVFERNRTPLRIRALGILLYHLGLSLRNYSMVLSSFEPISHESIRLWYHKSNRLFTVETQYREIIAVDETKIKINGKYHLLWPAIDINTWEVIGVWITQGLASIAVLNRLHANWEHVTFRLRKPIEQWFFLLKNRIKRFYRNWPYNTKLNNKNLINFYKRKNERL